VRKREIFGLGDEIDDDDEVKLNSRHKTFFKFFCKKLTDSIPTAFNNSDLPSLEIIACLCFCR
jgi:hypothetical protein